MPVPGARVRVLLVGPSCRILGGQAVQAARLMERLSAHPAVEAAFQPIDPELPGPLGALQRLKYLRSLTTWPVYWSSVAARARKFDVVHAFSASNLSFAVSPTPAILAAKALGKKIILNYRSGEAEDHLKRWKTALPTIRLVDEVVVPSGYLVEVFSRFGVRARTIANMVDVARYRFRQRSPLTPVFLSNRNLEPMYNVGCVLRAFARIQSLYRNAQLLVAGDGSQRPILQELSRELGLRAVKFLGLVPQKRMPELYDAADIYLNASEIDNLPGSILEAYSCGLPVITTNAGGIPYMVRDNETGLMVSCGDHDRMALRAVELLGDPALAARLAHNARTECARYAPDAVTAEWVGLYQALAHGHAEGAREDPARAMKAAQGR